MYRIVSTIFLPFWAEIDSFGGSMFRNVTAGPHLPTTTRQQAVPLPARRLQIFSSFCCISNTKIIIILSRMIEPHFYDKKNYKVNNDLYT